MAFSKYSLMWAPPQQCFTIPSNNNNNNNNNNKNWDRVPFYLFE